MSQVSSQSWWRVTTLALALCIGACGGGGGGGAGGGVVGNELSGTLRFAPQRASGPVLEAEPNDSVDTAHDLGRLLPGRNVVVRGHTTTEADDPFDGFRFYAPERVRVTAKMEFDDSSGNDFDMFIYEPSTMQVVERYWAEVSPETGNFHAKGVFFLVVNAFIGSGDYVLTVTVTSAASPIAEREPNGAWLDYTAGVVTQPQWLGELVPGDSIQVSGWADAAVDTYEIVYVSMPSAARVSLSLALPVGNDFNLGLVDGTQDSTNPAQLEYFGTFDVPEQGTIDVQAGTLLGIVVHAFYGRGAWSLTLLASAPSAGMSKPEGLLPRSVAQKSVELHRAKAPAHGLAFGRILGEFVAGEALLAWDETPAAAESQAGLGARAGKPRSLLGRGMQHVALVIPDEGDAEDRARATLARIAGLASMPGVKYAEPNGICHALAEPNDPAYNLQWHYPMIRLPEAWNVTTGDRSVVVAVIDTGSTPHPDLVANQVGGYDFISDAARAGDGDGRDGDPTDIGDSDGVMPSTYHGTHVAGTIGAQGNNGQGVTGVCWSVSIMHCRALGIGGGTQADIIAAILYAAGLPNASGALPAVPARVINMSLGGSMSSQAYQDAINAARAAGVTIFAAAGNSATSIPSYPAAYAGVISVSAVDAAANPAPYSNYGSTVDVACPGGHVTVDLNGDGWPDGVLSTLYDDSKGAPYPTIRFSQGTSMACPHAAGVAALMLSVNPGLTPLEIESIMTSTAEDRGAVGRDDRYGYGLVNAAACVRAAQGSAVASPALSIAPLTINLGSSETTRDAFVANVGDGVLSVTGLGVATDSGGSWLSAATFGLGDASRNVDGVRVSVSRAGLASGSYAGRVQVQSNGGSVMLQVLLRVGSSGASNAPNTTIYVLAIDTVTGQAVRQVQLNPTANAAFRLQDLPDGTYWLVAGSDDDGDGSLCGPGSWCGAWPVSSDPEPLVISEGRGVGGLEVLLAPDDAVGASSVPSGGTGPLGLRRWGCGPR